MTSSKVASAAPAVDRRRRARFRKTELTTVLAVVDGLSALLGAWLAPLVWSAFDREYVPTAGLTVWQVAFAILWFVILRVYGAGDLLRPRLGRRSIRAVLLTVATASALVLFGFYVFPFVAPRGSSLLSLPVAAFSTLALRFAYLRVVASPLLDRRVAVIGTDDAARRAAAAVVNGRGAVPYSLVAFVASEDAPSSIAGISVLRAHGGLWETLRELDVDLVVVGHTAALPPALLAELVRCFELGVEAVPATTLYEELTGRVMVAALEADWYAELPTRAGGFYAPVKRLIDVVIGSVAILLIPVAALIAVAIVLDSGPPILLRQVRVGRRGEEFVLHKFRTMRPNAETAGEPVWATRNDERQTRVGRVLRRFHADELPQLWDVVRGHMSLIGPRPERPQFVETLTKKLPLYRARGLVRPGITGWAQVQYPYAGSVEENLVKLEYDIYYVRHFSALLDLSIGLRTLAAVLGLARLEYISVSAADGGSAEDQTAAPGASGAASLS